MSLKTFNSAFWVSAILFWVYLFLKAVYMPLVNDEAGSFLTFVHINDLWPGQGQISANNHFLNTLSMYLGYHLWGAQEWALRLGSVLSFGIFAAYNFKMIRAFKSLEKALAFWILLLLSHYFIEFFSFARGYGMGLAFLSAGLYYGLFNSNNAISYLLSALCFTLASYANLNLIVPAIALAILSAYQIISNKKYVFGLIYIALCSGIFYFFYGIAHTLNEANELYIGSHSFWYSSKIFFEQISLYGASVLAPIFAIFLCIICLSAIITFIKSKGILTSEAQKLSLILLLSIIGIYLLHHFNETAFPVMRTGLHFYYLAVLALFFYLDKILAKYSVYLLIFFVPIGAKGLTDFKLYVSSDQAWAQEQIPSEFYFHLKKKLFQGESLSSDNGNYTHVWAFYNQKYGPLVNCQNYLESKKEYNSTYQIAPLKRRPDLNASYETVLYDAHSGLSLLKKKIRFTPKQIDENILQSQIHDLEFYKLVEYTFNELQSDLRITSDLIIEADQVFELLLTIEIKDEFQNPVLYKQIRVDKLSSEFILENRLNISQDISDIPKSGRSLKVYLWNPQKKSYQVNFSKVNLYQIINP